MMRSSVLDDDRGEATEQENGAVVPARTWHGRSKQLAQELAYSPAALAALAAAAVAAASRRRGDSTAGALSRGIAAGLFGWQYRASSQMQERLIRSAEDAAVLGGSLGATAPLFGRWAVEGDFAGMIARELELSPGLVVECGSGSTTLVIADRLRRAGSGRLVSLEHDASFAGSTRRLLASAGLDDVAAVVDAPLVQQTFGERTVAWYDRAAVEGAIDGKIDLLVVDGPPQTQPWARWGALEVLYPHLAETFVVLLDDGRTRETTNVVRAWVDEFADLELYWLDTVKGTWLLKRRDGSGMTGSLLRVARLLHPRPAGFGRWPVRR